MKTIFARLGELIRNLFLTLSGKDKTQIRQLNRKIPYMNKPISEESYDEIGMGVYVDYLESAIENGADMIAVVSRFGTGKSSLIELLKEKYHGWEKRYGRKCERVYCQVNLWSQLENNTEQTLELHRMFLYQLIAMVYPHKSSYFSRRTGRNFGMFKVSTESRWWSFCINFAVILLAVVLVVQYFADSIVASGFVEEKVLNLLILLGYLFCGIVVLLLIVKTEIIFSSKNSEGNRQVEENELIDLYREHVLLPKNWYTRLISMISGAKHIVVVIEDLDRTEDGDKVYHFLKELRKYYVPNDQTEKHFINQITFIVNIMPEDILQEKCSDPAAKNSYVYDKVFDYSLNLTRINIDNFDSVLEALIQEKREELADLGLEIQDSDNVHQIPGMPWIILGKRLTLRQVKERLNDAIVLFESLTTKFGKHTAEFPKCAAVAYLRSAFSEEFYALSDRDLENMVTWYAKEQGTETQFIEAFSGGGESKEEFLKTLYQMLEAHLIDGNYRSYFFNYPKNSYLYNVQETRVRNLIIYNENMTDEMREDIAEVAFSKNHIIIEAMENAIELVAQLPEVVLYSNELWQIAERGFPKYLLNLVSKTFSNISEIMPEHYRMIDSVTNMENGTRMLSRAILKNEVDTIVVIRSYILDKHMEHIEGYTNLFDISDAPLKKEEIDKLKDVSLACVLDMVKTSVDNLDEAVIDTICSRVLLEKDVSVQIKAEDFYVQLAETFTVASIAKDVLQYVLLRKKLIPKLEEAIYGAIAEGELDATYYFDMINGVELSEISIAQMERIQELDKPGMINEEICNKMKDFGYLKDYLLNMMTSYPGKVELTWEDFYAVMGVYGDAIWEERTELFMKIRFWGCKRFKDEMAGLEEFFQSPYPLITEEEMEHITHLDTAFELYDSSRAAVDEGDIFVGFCNRQFRKSTAAFSIFQYVAAMEKTTVPKVFYKLDMQKVRFSLMSLPKKLLIVEKLRLALKLNVPEEIVRFMDFTECLIPELEQEILPALKVSGNDDLCKAYIRAINKAGKVTKETIRNLLAMPNIYIYGDMLNEEMYKRRHYQNYVSSRTQEAGQFVIEYEKLDTLWNVYLFMFKNTKGFATTRACMYRNKEFLKLVQNRDAYKELPEESRMAMASIPQDENTLLDVLNYSDEFVISYFSKVNGFTSKRAAETFVKIMEKHQKYAQNSAVYNNVYNKLENAQLKGKYTKLYHKANS